jgi:hypothetical protein
MPESIPLDGASSGEWNLSPKDSNLEVTVIKRGSLNNARALEVKFMLNGKHCKAVTSSEDVKWHFQTHGETLRLFQFVSALQESARFAEVFDKEASRHPQDWLEIITDGKAYEEKGKEKNTRYNFPEICREILLRYSDAESLQGARKSSRKSGTPDLTAKPVVIHKVEHGEYTKVGQKDFGKGFPEFPRFISVILNWDTYHIQADINTDQCEWQVVPRDPSENYPKGLLKELKLVIPFMVQELEKPGNKYLAHTMLNEIRRKEYQHQWAVVVKGNDPLNFPFACREVFSTG